MSKSPKNTIFGSKTAISRPLINLKINTFNIKPTPKIFLALYTTPTNTKSSYKKPESLLKMWYPLMDPVSLLDRNAQISDYTPDLFLARVT